jgi:hypothetical protein
MVAWAVLFLQYFKRECSSYACRWNTLQFESQAHIRPDFYGVPTISEVP